MKKPNPLSGCNGQLMVTAAHRYCLGRSSYIVGACVEWLTDNWSLFDPNTQSVIVRDTVEALQDYPSPVDSFFHDWSDFAAGRFASLSTEQQKWVRDAVKHRGKLWPL